jgi:hypothetical protein
MAGFLHVSSNFSFCYFPKAVVTENEKSRFTFINNIFCFVNVGGVLHMASVLYMLQHQDWRMGKFICDAIKEKVPDLKVQQ